MKKNSVWSHCFCVFQTNAPATIDDDNEDDNEDEEKENEENDNVDTSLGALGHRTRLATTGSITRCNCRLSSSGAVATPSR
jgi:hypothetical protein